jgi:RNA polymerase sigma-70 factor (ECF subfamily)
MAELDQEIDWIRRSQRGDHEAFEEIVRQYQRMIHALTYRMTGSLADAEDLAQEVFIRAYQRIGNFRGEARFSSWLYRVATNACLNWRKAAARRDRLHDDWAAEAPPLASSAADDETSARIQDALLKLKPKQRAAVVLTLCEGQSHAEAARALGCSETTVSWRVFMAKRRLKKMLTTEITETRSGMIGRKKAQEAQASERLGSAL